MNGKRLNRQNRDASRWTRAGFTLVEMLVVLAIIAILIGLIVPAIIGAMNRANEASEQVEIQALSSRITEFKDTYGVYPPSQIVLREDGDYSPTTFTNDFGDSEVVNRDPSASASGRGMGGVFLRSLSVKYLEKLWPQIQLNKVVAGVVSLPIDYDGDGTINNGDYGTYYDWNGNGQFDQGAVFLTGDECLAFFLGGIPTGERASNPSLVRPNSDAPGLLGFSRNPLNPTLIGQAATANASRYLFLDEYDSSRLVDWDLDGFWEYLPVRKEYQFGGYAYFSSYGVANGYRPDDMNLYDTSITSFVNEPNELRDSMPEGGGIVEFLVNWQRPANYPNEYTPSYGSALLNSVLSPGPNPYTRSVPTHPNIITTPTTRVLKYWEPKGFQIISPGIDGSYGQGGAVPRGGNAQNNTNSAGYYEEVLADDDNLTNFTGTQLQFAGEE